MNVLLDHLRVLRATLQRLHLTPGASLLNIGIIGIALSLPVGGYVLLQGLQNLGTRVAGSPQISLFLSEGATAQEIKNIGERLRQHSAIERVEFVPRDAALKQLQQTAGLSDIVNGLNHNPLPDAYIVIPKSSVAKELQALRTELAGWPRMAHVQLDSAWIDKLDRLLAFGRYTVILLAALLSFALIAITFNTIRLQILTRREEIEVSKLIGAPDSFIRRPFLYFGLLQGLLGGLIAWMIIALSLLLLNQPMSDLAQLYASDFSLRGLSWADSLTLLGFSAYLGWLGAWFSVSQHLWQIEPR